MSTTTVKAMLVSLFAMTLLGLVPASARAAEGDAARQASVQKTAEAFIAAYEQGDAKAVAACWLPGGDYIDLTGRNFNGRAEIEDMFAETFAQGPRMKIRIDVASLRFPTPDTAIEHGTTSMIDPTGSVVSRADYTNTLVQKDGKWLLASVRESPYSPPSNYEHLRALEWAIGVWEHDVTEGHIAGIVFDWTPDNNFITSARYVRVNDEELANGSQTIGWDAAAKQIRSWSFEADGGFGESTWSNAGQKWMIKTTSVLRSGSTLTSTNIVTREDADHITVQTVDQKLDGKPLPDSAVMKMKRVE